MRERGIPAALSHAVISLRSQDHAHVPAPLGIGPVARHCLSARLYAGWSRGPADTAPPRARGTVAAPGGTAVTEIPYYRFPHILIYACQLPDERWAELLGLPVSDVAAWLDGEKERAIPANERLASLMAIIVALGHVRDGQGIARWLLDGEPFLDNVQPLEYLAIGNAPAPVILAARQRAATEFGLTPDSRAWPRD